MEGMRELLRNTLAKSLKASPVEDRLAAAWPLVCGRAMAAHGSVVGYEDGTVLIDVSDDVWLRQMICIRSQLATRMAQVADAKVSGIHFQVRHKSAVEKSSGERL